MGDILRLKRLMSNLKSYSVNRGVFTMNNTDKFRPDSIWNDGCLGFFEEVAPTRTATTTTTRWVAIQLWSNWTVRLFRKANPFSSWSKKMWL